MVFLSCSAVHGEADTEQHEHGKFLHLNGATKVTLGNNNDNLGAVVELTVTSMDGLGEQMVAALPIGVLDGTHLLTVVNRSWL